MINLILIISVYYFKMVNELYIYAYITQFLSKISQLYIKKKIFLISKIKIKIDEKIFIKKIW